VPFRSAKEDSGNALRSAVRVTHDLEVGRAVGHCRNVIATHGRPDARDPRHTEQKSRFLRPLFTGEEIWCQLFSEPGAVRTSPSGLSRRKGRRRVLLNGQKLWTTLAHESAFA